MIKMIAVDLDRTLLRTDKTISHRTKQILDRCKERGITVVFATARPKRAVMFDYTPDAQILHNGAIVYIGGERIYSCGIPAHTTKDILLSISRDFQTTISVEIDDVFYANFDVSTVWNYTQAITTDFSDLPQKPADKIIVGVSSMDDMYKYAKYLPDDLYIEMCDGKLGLIMHRGATKFQAIGFLARRYGYDINEIAAFGDDYNDIDMIRNCGVGVAMENAQEDVKAVADFVCGSNDDDGVANWLIENVLALDCRNSI